MSVYTKLSDAREKFHALELKKTGHNKFAGYYYFELGDFIIPALRVFKECGLLGFVSFGKESAELKIVDLDEPRDFIVIQSPMSTAALKGCHEVQNLGAVETYIRRYLWVAALEIVEHDALDATTGKDSPKHSPVQPVGVSDKRMSIIVDVAEAIKEKFAQDDVIGAYEEASGITDVEEKQALWKMLDSKVRSAIKKHASSLKEEAIQNDLQENTNQNL